MTDHDSITLTTPCPRKTMPSSLRPATSYMPTSETPRSPDRRSLRMSFHLPPSHDLRDWQSFNLPARESGYIEDPTSNDQLSEIFPSVHSKVTVQTDRRRSRVAQLKSSFSAITRRLSTSVTGGKSRQARDDMLTIPRSPFLLHRRRSQMFNLSETASNRPKSRGFLNGLTPRRKQSMPILSSHEPLGQPSPWPSPPSHGFCQPDSTRLAPVLSNYLYGGSGARASAAAQNQALFDARGTPLPSYDAAISIASDIQDAESGIGISVDNDRRHSAAAHVARCDPARYLATELLEQIFSHLDPQSLMIAERVSRRWADLCHSQAVWRKVFYHEYSAPRAGQAQSRHSNPGMGKSTLHQDFRKLYKVRKMIDQRWQNGEAAAIYLNGHKDSVYCVQFDEDKIVTGSRDQTIRVWDARTYQCIKKLGPPNNPRERIPLQRTEVEPQGIVPFFRSEASSPDPKSNPLPMWHQASVLCLQYDDDILVSGSSDFTCIVWDIKNGYQPMFQLLGHSAGVLDVSIDSRRIITCSKDTTIKIWDRFSGRLLKTLSGHRGPVNAVQIRGSLLASASGDGMSKLWRLEDGQCIKEFHSRERGLACVEFSEDGRTIFAGGNDHVIYEYNTVTGTIERELQGHKDLVRSLHLDSANGRIVSGSYDHSIKVWDAKRGTNSEDGGLQINLEGWTSSWMLAAKSNYRKIACASQDGRVVVVDFGYGIDGVQLVEA